MAVQAASLNLSCGGLFGSCSRDRGAKFRLIKTRHPES